MLVRSRRAERGKLLLSAATSLIALGVSSVATAQIEEVVVTAQKVEENLQDVPISVTAVSGEAIAASSVFSLESLGDLVPSLTFRKGTSMANNALFLRGVGTISFSIAAEPSVSTVVDGIVLSRSGQAFTDFLDIERIEVLRGPQGTLFGKNASAGVVNIVSKGGTDEFEAEANLAAFEDNEYRAKLSLAGPLADGLTGRLTASYGSFDGFIRNINPNVNDDVNGYQTKAVRGLLDWDASDAARFRFIADYFDGDNDCCAEITGVSRGAVLDAELGLPKGVALGEDQRYVNHNLVSRSIGRQWGLTARGEFDVFNDHTFTAIAGYRDYKHTEIREGDFLPRALVGTPQLHDPGTTDTAKQYSMELRLASDQARKLTYQLGGFYWKSENFQTQTRRDITCATSTLPVDPRTGGRPCNTADLVNTLFPTATSVSNVDVENYALFAQPTYNFTDALRLIVGLRWTHDAISFDHTRAPAVNETDGTPAVGPGLQARPAGGTIATGGNGTNLSTGSLSNDNVSGKVAFQADLSDSVMTYVSYTRGYKGPAFNIFFNHTRPDNSSVIDEETSDAYEIGLKSRLADDRVQLNIAAFQTDYKGYQANNFVVVNGALVTNLRNAGNVRTKGFEFDFLANPLEGLDLFANVAYADARVQKFNPNPLTNAPDARNGTPMPLAPKWNIAVGSNYETALNAMGVEGRLYLNATYNWTDDHFSDLGRTGPIESYGIWNANIGVSDADDKYRLTLVLRNIGDTSYVLLNTAAGQRLHIPRDADRYAGLTLRVKFN
jgi:iron complex outermembrane receptor protein